MSSIIVEFRFSCSKCGHECVEGLIIHDGGRCSDIKCRCCKTIFEVKIKDEGDYLNPQISAK